MHAFAASLKPVAYGSAFGVCTPPGAEINPMNTTFLEEAQAAVSAGQGRSFFNGSFDGLMCTPVPLEEQLFCFEGGGREEE